MSSEATKQATVIIPALNEEYGICLTLKEIMRLPNVREIIVVDGGSLDGTAEIAERTGARVLIEKNTGYGNAIYQGVKLLDSNVQYVVFTDADFTYPAKFIPEMLKILEGNNDVGMVIGSRFKGKTFAESNIKPLSIANKVISGALRTLHGIELDDPLSNFRVIRAGLLREWKPKSKGFDIEVEINHYVERQGYRIVEIPIHYRPRIGEKKLSVKHGLSILSRILRMELER